MSEETKKRVIRILINLGVLFVIVTVSGLSIPGIFALFFILPNEGPSLGTISMLISVTISSFFALRILLDMIKMVDLVSDWLIKHIPGLNFEKKISVVRALKEIIIVLVLVLFSTMTSPLLLMIPNIGAWISFGVSVIVLAVSLILIYDAGKTLYAIFESGIQLFIDKLSEPKGQDLDRPDEE